jgi:hypothetical protein
MRDPRLVAWRKEVTRTPLLQPTTKVLLLDLFADGMCAAGTVSVPRVDLARRQGISTRSIDSRIADAVSTGFLLPLTQGRKHVTAVHMIGFPSLSAKDGVRAENGSGRRRRDAEKWRQNGAQREGFKRAEDFDSAKDGVRAENGHIGTSDGSARRTGFAPVVRRATNEPAHPNGVPDLTPTDTGTSAYLSANGTATLTDTGVAADALVVLVQGQNWLQREGHQETHARLSTADLRFLVARCGGAL